MRFIHVSDVRLGLDPESEKSFGRQRASEFRKTFEKVLDKVQEEGCDLLLVSGSLFCHQPVSGELEAVNRLFLSLPATQVVIIAGKSDPLRKNSPVRSFRWAPNVHYVTETGLTRISFPSLNTNVYAASQTEGGESGLSASLSAFHENYEKDEAAAKLLLLPALPREMPEGELKKELAPFSYAGFGGEGEREPVHMKAGVPGPLEPASMTESGEHGIFIGDISAVSGRLIDLSFLPMAAASYVPLLVNVTEDTGAEELLELLRSEMEKRGRNNIYRLRLSGSRDPETNFDLQRLTREFRIAELVDETEPVYDFPALFAEHPQDLIGFYISAFQKNRQELSELEKKAMYYGIHALLKTAESRTETEREQS